MFSWIKAIGSFLNRIQSRFTYRQRFLFFSLIYALGMPFPSYWMLKSQSFLISRAELQILGLKSLTASNEIGYLFINEILDQYQSSFHLKPTDSENHKHEVSGLIQEELNKMADFLERARKIPSASLGYGFSTPKEISINQEAFLQVGMEMLKNISLPSYMSETKKNTMEKFPLWINEQKKIFDVDVNQNLIAHQLIQINFDFLPQALVSSVNLFLLRNKIDKESHRSASDPVMIAGILEPLKENLLEMELKFKNLYRMAENGSFSSLNGVQNAIFDYRNSLENFIKIGERAEVSFEDLNALNQVLLRYQDVLNEINVVLNQYFNHCLRMQRLQKNIFIIVFALASLVVATFVALKVLSRHLLAIYEHIQSLAKGNFTKCFCSDASDEFGSVGLAFDKMGSSVQNVVSELRKLGKQLTDSINQITKTAKEQEGIVDDQVKAIKDIETTANQIARNSRDLANTMNELSLSSKQSSLANDTKSGLDHMHKEMSELTATSTNILMALVAIKDKVSSTKSLVAFLARVSDQAGLLSLNAAIETTHVGQDKRGFSKITQEIQRFTEKTSHSTENIQEIIKQMSVSVAAVRTDVNKCLGEITEGGQRLMSVNEQLSSITKQGKLQVLKFDGVNYLMQVQAFAAEEIIKSIKLLSDAALENTLYTKILHETAEELGVTAIELQKVLDLFFTKAQV